MGYSDQQRLTYKKVFLKHLIISILLLLVGTLPEVIEWQERKSPSYFGSQMLFIFFMFYLFISSLYMRLLGKVHPEFSDTSENINDKLASGLLYIGMITLPFVIDSCIVQQAHNHFFMH